MRKGTKILVVLVVLAAALGGGFWWLHGYAQKEGRARVEAFFEQVKEVAQAQYGDVHVDLLGLTASIRDMKLRLLGGKVFSVQEFTLRDYEEEAGMPKAMNFSVRGMEVPVTAENLEDAYELFSGLGYKSIFLDFDLNYAFDDAHETFQVRDMALSVRDLAALTFGVKLDNVALKDLVASEGASAMTMLLTSAELNYKDRGLFDKALEAAAKEEGRTGQDLLAEMDASLDQEIEAARADHQDFALAALEQVKKFIHNPGSLSMRIDPESPVGFLALGEIQDVAQAISRLNIHIEAKDK